MTTKSEKYTFFWDGVFSQWYPSFFKLEDRRFNCAEQYMMYQKAITFGDKDSSDRIMDCANPSIQKKMGKLVKGYDEEVWKGIREEIVYTGNYEKFRQNLKLYEELKATKGTVLVEASPYDLIWGVGLAEDDPRILNRRNWRGQNLLGKILTKLREDTENGFN
ncbi:MAG TPA: NADAR family protein [Candidatus Nanoarchaeia archaeon]|nr:NADAR family protein [Candidatus Nanoarchaeia archaeon]